MTDIARVGQVETGWGESLVWDDRRRRLYFVDCAAQTLHWIEGDDLEAGAPVRTLQAPSMAAGLVAVRDDDRLVTCLADGLYVVDADTGTFELLSPYPSALGERANDACADLAGNLITGTLNLGPAEGSSWWFSATEGWRLLDPDISNTNGPAHLLVGGESTLVIGDTSAQYFAYPYDAATGRVGERRVFGDVSSLPGGPDGSTVDADGGLWCALFGGGPLVRFTEAGIDRTIDVPATNPTDVTFGGPDLDRLYVTTVAGDGTLDGALLVITDLGVTGRPEPRFSLTG